MKQYKIVVICMCILLLLAGGVYAQQKTVRILAIGNSFSQDAVEQYLHELAEAEGISTIIGNMFIGGCSLERHVKNARDNAPAYAYRKIGTDGKKREKGKMSLETVLASLPELIEYVKARLPKKTKLMLHQTWAYASTSRHSGFKNYNCNQLTMYQAIADAVKKAAKANKIKIVIPSGTAIQNARTSFIGDHLNRDGYHLDVKIGRYTAACTWFERIFKHNVVGNPYTPEGLDEARKAVAQKAAHAAVKHPYKVTDLSITN